MTMNNTNSISLLLQELGQRAARSYISKISPVNDPLREHLRELFERAPGESGSFLAEPVIEASFGWKQAEKSMHEYIGELLNAKLVEAMHNPPNGLGEQKFDRYWKPYLHQVKAWKDLQKSLHRSIIVSSGTGSGKTECFLVPVLNDLANQLETQRRLVGVQALMLYPLNALINSQRDRLKAWTDHFNGAIRYCLYNGDTPDQVPASKQNNEKSEVMSRQLLRQEPPPILVTNATMLEYMLVRQQDRPILDQSQGRLRWVILDEAHTYIGSHAAELSLLLRRVLHAFGVSAKDVRFIATSATIADGEGGDTVSRLEQYLADLAGVDSSRVSVIKGHRTIPKLPEVLVRKSIPLPDLKSLQSLDQRSLFEILASNPEVRQVRNDLIERGPRTLSELETIFNQEDELHTNQVRLLDVLDLVTRAKDNDELLLPYRAHLFHRTQNGLWACCNKKCPGKIGTALDSPGWVFGKLFMNRREACDIDVCKSRVYELVFCESCGAEYLASEEQFKEEKSFLIPKQSDFDDDLLDEDSLIEDEAEEATYIEESAYSFPRLITNPASWDDHLRLDVSTGQIHDHVDADVVGVVYPENGQLKCVRCGKKEARVGEIFRPARSSAAYHLLMSTPTLLEHTPTSEKKDPNLPFNGRRMITFSDSRQGTARFSLQAQLDTERNYVRSWLYHQTSANTSQIENNELIDLEKQIRDLEDHYQINKTSLIKDIIDEKKRDLQKAKSVETSRLPWTKAAQLLKDTKELSRWLPEQWRHTSLFDLPPYEIARLCLIREFARRPKRQVSLETLGLVSLHYPKINQIRESKLPAAWKQLGMGLQPWQDFLKIAIDFVIRGNCAVYVPPIHSRWIGTNLPRKFLVEPNAEIISKRNVRWPQLRHGGVISRLPALLIRALQLNQDEASDRAVVNDILFEAWIQIRSMLLEQEQEGYRLDLEKNVEFAIPQEGWFCPVTRRFLDRTLLGWTPYLNTKLPDSLAKCKPIKLPHLKFPFGKFSDGIQVPRDQIIEWLEKDELISDLREQGLWTAYSDRLAMFSSFFRINEHSAQQSSSRLRALERGFKDASINILSCSTTMEMGVDIGGISSVAMNNAPPSPANYLQRAGRAGRRNEPLSVCFTLCQSIPHGENVFANPVWPFRTPIAVPQVSLQSDRIIQRHINALVLTRFLQQHAQDLTSLQCGWFFKAAEGCQDSPAAQMCFWVCKHEDRAADDWLISGIKSLSKRTSLEGISVTRLLETVGLELRGVSDRWCEEENALDRELAVAGGDPLSSTKANPAQLAISKQLKRIRDEYLLGELASKGFLPGYGFPTSVVPFVNTTLEDLRRSRADKMQREDNRMQRRGYPTRDLPMAIRDYAPGTDIVIDGQVYTSEGVTLNWHIPAGDYTSAPEVQAFRTAWRCRTCGASGSRSMTQQKCTICYSTNLVFRPYLEPAGFTVNILQQPHNDVSYRKYIPIYKPWITAGQTPWSPLPRPELGRYRFSQHGQIFYQSGGLSGLGYAVCLRCGKAASENNDGGAMPSEMDNHYKLRGGENQDGRTLCEGNEQDWAIKRNQWLGMASKTDVFELQLQDPETGAPVNDDVMVYSLSAALRRALAEELGITDREISCTSIPSRTQSGQKTYSIILYDTASGGAGFVASTAQLLPSLLGRAKSILTCQKNCDSACHSCLLTYDTQFEVSRLNRNSVLPLLSGDFLEGLRLPSELHYFGEGSRLEFDNIEFAIIRETQHADIDELRVYLGGDPKEWDFLEWSMRVPLIRYASEGCRVSLSLPEACLVKLDSAVANPLASLVEMAGIQIRSTSEDFPDSDVPSLLAEVGGPRKSVRWAASNPDCLSPGELWGRARSEDRCISIRQNFPLPAMQGTLLRPGDIRQSPQGTFRELIITDQFNGSVTELGKNFVSACKKQISGLDLKTEKKVPITKILYRDRYLASPLNIKLVYEWMRGTNESFRAVEDLEITLETIDTVRASYKLPELLHNDWQLKEHRNLVLKSLFEGMGGQFNLIEKPRTKASHVREVIITWADGATWNARLDHGFGFLRSKSMVPFNFNAEPDEQVEELKKAEFRIFNSIPSGSHFYLSECS